MHLASTPTHPVIPQVTSELWSAIVNLETADPLVAPPHDEIKRSLNRAEEAVLMLDLSDVPGTIANPALEAAREGVDTLRVLLYPSEGPVKPPAVVTPSPEALATRAAAAHFERAIELLGGYQP